MALEPGDQIAAPVRVEMEATLYLHLLPQLAVAVAVAGALLLPRIGSGTLAGQVAEESGPELVERAPLAKEIMVEREVLQQLIMVVVVAVPVMGAQ